MIEVEEVEELLLLRMLQTSAVELRVTSKDRCMVFPLMYLPNPQLSLMKLEWPVSLFNSR